MQALANRSRRHRAKNRLAAASLPVVEQVESRIFMSGTVAAWNFDSLAIASNILSPAPSAGSGTALTVGLQTSGTNANSPGGVYAYPNANASGTGDSSDILNGTGNNPGTTNGNPTDHSSSGDTTGSNATNTNPGWRVRGTSDGWSSNAVVASQGAQFTTSTAGQSGISLTFDLDPSSGGAPSEVAVQYNTNYNNAAGWVTVPAANLSLAGYSAANGTTDGVTIASNSTNPNIVNGGYFQIANNADALWWQNGLAANISAAAGASVENDANFGVRIVNAASGNTANPNAEFEVTGTGATPIAYPTAGSGNWRLDNISINASGGVVTPPSINSGGNPTNQSVPAGSPVSFTASASGSTPLTVQWYKGVFPDETNPVSGATSSTLTFTTSSTAADNGNQYYALFTNSAGTANTTSATLSDPLAAVSNVVSPSNVSATSGTVATFTASATGSPVPTVQWQSNTVSGAANDPNWQNISGATSTTYSFTTATNQNNTFCRAVFTNSQSPSGVATSSAKLTVSGVTIAAWSFPAVVAAPDNTPTQTSGVAGAGAAQSIGMTNTYAYASTTATNSVTNDDITSVAGTSPATTEDVWRVRGHYVATGTAPNIGSPTGSANVNGWNLNAPSGTQGVEFDVNTTGYQAIQASFDWEATNQGVKNLQEQYNLNVGNAAGWTNINSPLVAKPGNYLLANPIDVSAITGANNDPNFGIRMVSIFDPNGAADGLTQVTDANGTHYPYASATSGPYNNSSGNWGFDNVIVTGTQIPAPPTITPTGNPANVTVTAGSPASFTAAATGFPTPTVQWEVATPLQGGGYSSFSNISGATSTTFTIPSTTSAQNQNEYEAVFTNTTSPFTANTTFATLTVNSLPTVTAPAAASTVAVSAGNSVTLTSAATGSPAPTLQWEVATPNGSGGFNTPTNISGATSSPYTFTPTEASTGDEYLALWTNAAGSTPSPATTVIVTGQPIAQWFFNKTLGAPFNGDQTPSATNGNSPTPSFQTTGSNDTLVVNGLDNLYFGTQALPESDVFQVHGTLNPNFTEFVQRIRGGGGTATASNGGRPDGWSQLAPQASQGVQYNINTTGYSNITLHFDWQEGGIADMQPQYLNNGVWTNIGSVIQTTTSDFAGATANGSPTGITVALPSNSVVNDNANLQVRLAAVYDPSLPSIVDANTFDDGVNGDPSTLHGQFAAGGTPGPQDAEQLFQIPDVATSGTLSFGGQTTTSPVTLDPTNPAATAAAIQAGLQSLSTIGSGGVTVIENANDSTGTQYTVQFTGGNANTAEPNVIATSDYTNLVAVGIQPSPTGGNPSPTFTLTVTDGNGAHPVTVPYNASFGALQTLLQGSGATNASQFTVQDAHDFTGWEGYAINIGADTGATLTGSGANLVAPQNFAMTTPFQQLQTGGASGLLATVFDGDNTGAGSGNQGNWELGNISFNGDTKTGAPGITLQPVTQSATATYPLTLTASAYSETTVTGVQWKFSTNGGGSFNPVIGSGAAGSATSGTNLSGTGPAYNSTFTFTPPTSQETVSPAYEYEAVFTNANGSQATVPATISVVPPIAPVETIPPISTAVEEGNVAIFTATATGSPAPSVQWQLLSSTGAFISNINNGANASITNTNPTVANNQETVSTLNYTTNVNASENGDKIVAVFSNNAGTDGGNLNEAATLTVFRPETAFTAWNFNNDSQISTNDPAPNIGTGTVSIIGMNLAASQPDGGSGYPSAAYALADGDITNSPGATNSNFTENTFRFRGGPSVTLNPTNEQMSGGVATLTVGTAAAGAITPFSPILVSGLANQEFDSTTNTDANGNPIPFNITSIDTTAGTISYQVPGAADVASTPISVGNVYAVEGGGSPGNGWSVFAPSDSQGAQFSSSTQGYTHVYVTLDWYSTKSGILDGQPEYTLDGTNWIPLGGTIQANGNDFFGATAGTTSGAISSESATNGVATVVAANTFTVGQPVSMANSGSPFNGTFTITAVASDHSTFSFKLTGTNANATIPSQPPTSPTATATENGLPIPLTFDVSNVAGASNNPNFGIRLVTVKNPTINAYATASSSDTNPAAWPGASGNWRIGNVVFHGVPDWLDPNSTAQWTPSESALSGGISSTATTLTVQPGAGTVFPATPFKATLGSGSASEIVTVTAISGDTFTITRGAGGTTAAAWPALTPIAVAGAGTLNVTGPATIIGDPETLPTVAINGNLGNIPVDPQMVGSTAAAQLLIQPLVTNSAIHLGGITLSNGAGLDMASVQGVGDGGLNGVERAQGANNVLVLGTADAITQEQLVSNVATLTANNNFYVGDTVQVQGATSAGDGPFDGTFTITAATPTTFSYTVQGSNADIAPQSPNGTPTASDQATAPIFSVTNGAGQAISSVAWDGSGNVTVLASGTYAVGQRVVIAGVNTPDQAPDTTVLDGTYVITGLVAGGFTYADSNPNLNGPDSVTPGAGATAAIASSFDLEDNDLVAHGGNDGSSDSAAIQAAAVAGRNAPIDPSTGLPTVGGFQDGTWTGGGLTSSAAANEAANQGNEYTALAVVQNSELPLGQFSSWNVGGVSEPLRSDGNDTIVKYTYVGDWALEGAVNHDSFSIFNSSYNHTNVPFDWAYGSYNGGEVNHDSFSVFNADWHHGVTTGTPL